MSKHGEISTKYNPPTNLQMIVQTKRSTFRAKSMERHRRIDPSILNRDTVNVEDLE